MDFELELELAAAAAKARRKQARQPTDPLRPIGLINEGIARGFDGLAGPLNRGVNAVLGTNLSQTPTADAMDMTGVARRQPEGIGGQAMVGAGEAASYLVPLAGAGRIAAGGVGMASQAGRTLTAPFVNAPVTATAAEMAGGAGFSAAEAYARQQGAGDAGAMGAGFGGGVVAGLGTAALGAGARGAMALSPVVALGRGVRAAVAPFTEKGSRVIAEDAMRRLSADPDRAAGRLLDQENVGNLTPAQQTGEPGLMAVERGYAARDPALRETLEAQTGQSRDALAAEGRAGAQGRTAADTRQFFQERVERHKTFLDGLVQRAEQRADTALRSVEPGQQPMAASENVRVAIDRAFDQAATQERQLWERVPRTVEIDTSRARQALAEAMDETTDVSVDSIPGKALRFLGDGADAFGEQVTMARLHRLYSEMRRASREAIAQNVPDEFRKRQADKISSAILADIEATEGVGNTARLLADARAFSSQMNEAFGQDTIARVRAVNRNQGERVREGLTLDATVGQMRRGGAIAVDDIRRAVGNEADFNMDDYLRSVFQGKVVRGDRIDIPRAETFIRDNPELMERFPGGFQRDVRRAVDAARNAGRTRDVSQEALRVLGDRNAPGMVGFINAKAGQEIAGAIFTAPNPAQAARALARAAGKDQTGDALLGLKGGVVDEVIRRAMRGDTLTGDALFRQLNDPEVLRVVTAVLPGDEVSRLRTVAAQLRKLDTWDATAPLDLENAPNSLVATFMQIQAAKAGRALGTGTIQVPGMFVKRVRDLLGRIAIDRADALVHEAIRDPKMMAALLTGPGSSRVQIQRAEQTLSTWATGVLAASQSEE